MADVPPRQPPLVLERNQAAGGDAGNLDHSPRAALEGLIGQEWTNQWHGQGPVTGLSVAEGVGVLALTDRQQVLAVNPASGKERWRAAIDGRIDSQPTIFRGAVYVRTRAGWLYALNRDTGELICASAPPRGASGLSWMGRWSPCGRSSAR